jgi:lipoyl-dependent peroxiredoxin
MPEREARAVWEGGVPQGKGSISLGSGACEAPYSFGSRFESGPGTNPEELLGAAHAGCFSMALALGLTHGGHPPTRISTTARVGITKTDAGFRIPRIDLTTEAEVPGLDEEAFRVAAEQAKSGCPVSVALSATEIHLEAKLAG